MGEHKEVMGLCRKLVDDGVAHDGGFLNSVVFLGEYAIKYPKDFIGIGESENISLARELFVGEDIKKNGFPVPRMYALDAGNKNRKPFLVMERLYLKNRRPNDVEVELFKGIREQIRNAGYNLYGCGYLDISGNNAFNNWGVDKEKDIYLYGFRLAGGARVDELMKDKIHLIKPNSQIVLKRLKMSKANGGALE